MLLVLIPSPKAIATKCYQRDLWSDPVQLLLCKKSSAEVRKVTLSTTCPCTNNRSTVHAQKRAECYKNRETETEHVTNLPKTTYQQKVTECFPALSLVIQMVATGILNNNGGYSHSLKMEDKTVWYFQDEM